MLKLFRFLLRFILIHYLVLVLDFKYFLVLKDIQLYLNIVLLLIIQMKSFKYSFNKYYYRDFYNQINIQCR